MTSRHVDVAIIGAGAAGCSAACAIAPTATVAIVDRRPVPGWQIGETLPGAARRLLQVTGAWQRFSQAQHPPALLKISRWGSDQPVELDAMRDPDGPGWHLDRVRFEADLRAVAIERGAVFSQGNVEAISACRAGWNIVLETGETITAKRLIDASGRRTRLLQRFGQRKLVVDRLACAYQRLPASGRFDPATYAHAVEHGWWYTAMLPQGMRLVSFYGDADSPAFRNVLQTGPVAAALRVPGLRDALGESDSSLAEPPKACAAHSVARSAAGHGWIAAGDAAIALDPLSSQGLFNALATGVEAGEATLALLHGDQTATQRFAERVGRIWQAYLRHHAHYYGMEARWPESLFWKRRVPHGGQPRA